MNVKAKVTKLEKRVGATRCRHCGATRTAHDRQVASLAVTEEEMDETVNTFLNRYFAQFNQEELLQRLAEADPAKRQSVAHVYPLGGGSTPPSYLDVVSDDVRPLDVDP
jgi:hypothetical protein